MLPSLFLPGASNPVLLLYDLDGQRPGKLLCRNPCRQAGCEQGEQEGRKDGGQSEYRYDIRRGPSDVIVGIDICK